MDPSLSTAATLAFEKVINKALEFDPASRERIKSLTDILAIECSQPKFTLFCSGSEDGVNICSYCDGPVTTHLSGSATAFLSLAKQPTNLANTGVELSGSTALLHQWQQLLKNLDIDWEEAISQLLGDIAGPTVADGIRKAFSWAQQQGKEQQRLAKEFLTEELSLFPNKSETQHLHRKLQDTTMHAERLEARLKELQKKYDALNNKEET